MLRKGGMLRKGKIALAAVALLVAGAIIDAPAAQKAGPTTPKGTTLAAGEPEIRRLLLLMDKDKNGKISKQEFMSFMEAEFDRLDVNHDGELDAKELSQTHLRWVGK